MRKQPADYSERRLQGRLLFGLDAGLVEQGLVALEFGGDLGRELGGRRPRSP
jgi:hypothetical protein